MFNRLKKQFEELNKPLEMYDDKELVKATIISLIICEIPTVLFSLVFGVISYPMSSMNLFYAINCAYASAVVFILCYRFLKKKFNFYATTNKDKFSFEGKIVLYLFAFFGFPFSGAIMGGCYGNPIQGFGFGFPFFYPCLVMFFKRNVFSEKTKISDEADVIGYDPKFYYMLGVSSGVCLIFMSFVPLNNICFHHSTFPLWLSICYIILSLVFEFLVLSPEIWNKYLPFEIQKKDGLLKYCIIAIVIEFVLSAIITCLSPLQ